ncbi:MAG TPA: ribonuclease Z, partial [Xanthomarina gelatinilytica]|nr:ribonuclease Z [Xanthomarina gelatinilytica]
DMNAAIEADIDMAYFNKLKQGFDVENNKGKLVKNETVTKDPPEPRSYAFCSDTAYNEKLVNNILGVTALYHESTFLEKHEKLTIPTKH